MPASWVVGSFLYTRFLPFSNCLSQSQFHPYFSMAVVYLRVKILSILCEISKDRLAHRNFSAVLNKPKFDCFRYGNAHSKYISPFAHSVCALNTENQRAITSWVIFKVKKEEKKNSFLSHCAVWNNLCRTSEWKKSAQIIQGQIDQVVTTFRHYISRPRGKSKWRQRNRDYFEAFLNWSTLACQMAC